MNDDRLLPTARTAAEARAYIKTHACECGRRQLDARAEVIAVGDLLAYRYRGRCTCGRTRELTFRAPTGPLQVETGFGSGRSELLNPSEWVEIAGELARTVPATPPSTERDRLVARADLALAIDAIEQAQRLMAPDEPPTNSAPGALAPADVEHATSAEYDDSGAPDPRTLTAIHAAYVELLAAYAS